MMSKTVEEIPKKKKRIADNENGKCIWTHNSVQLHSEMKRKIH